MQNSKYTWGAIALVALGALGIYFLSHNMDRGSDSTLAASDFQNATYEVDGAPVTFKNGVFETATAPGSATMDRYSIFGNEVSGDFDGNGKQDVAFLLTHSAGGSGTFFYLAAALQKEDGWHGLNALLLGDRIAPQGNEFRDGKIIVNYADRNDGEPMSTAPSVGISKYFAVINGVLNHASQYGIEWFLGESEDGPPQTQVVVTVNGAEHTAGTYQGTCQNIESGGWKLLPGEVEGVICWAGGGGSEIGIFRENGKLVLKEGELDEGSAEVPGTRGNFKTLFEFPDSPVSTQANESGILGTVMLGPRCPVQSDPPDPKCADTPFAVKLEATSPDGAKVIKQFSSAKDGTFKIILPPGKYSVRNASTANPLPTCVAHDLVVEKGKYTQVTISCDTGIR